LHAPPLAIRATQVFAPAMPALHQYWVVAPVSQSASLAQFVLHVVPLAQAKFPGQSSPVPSHAPLLQPPASWPSLQVSAHVMQVAPQKVSVVHALHAPLDGQ
jgi:hypothetical protein